MNPAAEKRADEAITVAMEFAECKLSLAQMIDFVWLQVHLILGSQRARLLAGLTEEPDASEIDRAACGMAVVKFLENLRDRPKEAAAWLRSRDNG
jgi:hypothetical protein